jgi:cell division protein FtsI (penicillin-binding protein 3)
VRRRQTVVDRRIRLLLAVLVVAFAATLGRAVWLQAVQARPLGALAASQHEETVAVPAPRGTIYDRSGVELAIGERATTVYADPRQIVDPRLVAGAAAEALRVDSAELLPQVADRSRGFVYIARQADPDDAELLTKRKLDGVYSYPEERRRYPQGTVAAHVLGFAGVDNKGLAGIEQALDRELAGTPGSQTVVKDATGRVIDVASAIAEQPGRNVYLTIDHNLQANAEELLAATVKRWSARSASAVILDPKTGEVLAMAVAPRFNANRFGRKPPDMTRNRAVTDTYEPGSTFKLVTAAAVLSEGLVSPSTSFTLPYSMEVSDRVIHDSHPRGTERMSVSEIISRSSNVGTVTLAQMLGATKLASWIERFGFGRKTEIDFPGETPGIVLPLDRWSGSTIGNVPIGQGIGVTAIQLAAAYAAVANGGVWVQPHVVRQVEGEAPAKPARRRIVSQVVAETVVSMLLGVVDEEGTGSQAAVPGYHVAGKTGTAAKPDEKGGYSDTRYVASFVGLVPATDPHLVILITVDEPREAIWGGTVAAPAFQQIAQFALQYLEVPPDAPLTGAG